VSPGALPAVQGVGVSRAVRTALALALLALAGLLPASAEAKRSTCSARHSSTVESTEALRLYARPHHHLWVCAFANGRRFQIGHGSQLFADATYHLDHLQLAGSAVAYVVSEDGVDYTVGQVWLRDVRKGRTLLAGVSPVVREDCALGDARNVDSLVLAPRGHVAWGVTYSCGPGLGSSREQIVAFKPGGRPRLLDAGALDAPDSPEAASLALGQTITRLFWMHGDAARSAEL
jgi:hypothetical protein